MRTVPNHVSASGGVVIPFPSAAMIPPVPPHVTERRSAAQPSNGPHPLMSLETLRELGDSYSGVETLLIEAGVVLHRIAELSDNGTLRALYGVLQVIVTEVDRQRSAAAEGRC